ncbi:hypothetical protein TSOC_007810 [Tetrabaena socialis]|uniref:SBP-type domain-containing protein n=1 Tax=Tetrabaena socialis TaxID=47790 RepID=A0A2J8A066_9CHLO|nr:hypothetical protein TSOC_007810 [Tetrabaena socialis]|eukprot:PNH05896.1 hypothetical protein TSOC_007810 [Tetrabaena socialis]
MDGDLHVGELWDLDTQHTELGWTLAGYRWDPVGLVATKRTAEAAALQVNLERFSGGDSGGTHEHYDPGMELEPHEDGDNSCLDPDVLAAAPVYLPQPAGCKSLLCQVAGCGQSLEGMKGYFLRHRVCEEHSKRKRKAQPPHRMVFLDPDGGGDAFLPAAPFFVSLA